MISVEGEGEIKKINYISNLETGVTELTRYLLRREDAKLRRHLVFGAIAGSLALSAFITGLQDPEGRLIQEFTRQTNIIATWASGIPDINIDPHLISTWFKRSAGFWAVVSGVRMVSVFESSREISGFKKQFAYLLKEFPPKYTSELQESSAGDHGPSAI